MTTLRLFVQKLEPDFRRKGVEFLYLVGMGEKQRGLNEKVATARITRSPFFFLGWVTSGVSLRTIVRMEIDVLHIHTPAAALSLYFVLRSLRRSDTKLIYTARGGFSEGRLTVRKLLWRAVDPGGWNFWSHIGVVNEHLRLSAMRTHRSVRVHMLSLGGATPNINPKIRPVLSARKSDDIRLAWVGRFSKDKNVKDFLRLVRVLAEDYSLPIRGFVIGESNSIDSVSSPRNDENVEFLGWLDCPQTILAGCDLLISTSEREGYGLVPVEAALVGTPTMAYRTHGTSKSVPEVKGRLLPTGDYRALASEVVAWYKSSAAEKCAWRRLARVSAESLVQSGSNFDVLCDLYEVPR